MLESISYVWELENIKFMVSGIYKKKNVFDNSAKVVNVFFCFCF